MLIYLLFSLFDFLCLCFNYVSVVCAVSQMIFLDLLSRIWLISYCLDDPHRIKNESILRELFARCRYLISVFDVFDSLI